MPQSEITDLEVGPGGLKLEGKDRAGTSEEASAGIPFGVMVCRGTADDGILLLNTSAAAMATDTALVGITLFDHHFARNVELDADGALAPEATCAVLTKGTCLVQVEEAVAPGDAVHVRVVTGGSDGYGPAGAENAGAFAHEHHGLHQRFFLCAVAILGGCRRLCRARNRHDHGRTHHRGFVKGK